MPMRIQHNIYIHGRKQCSSYLLTNILIAYLSEFGTRHMDDNKKLQTSLNMCMLVNHRTINRNVSVYMV